MSAPKLTVAHCGCGLPQSMQLALPGNRATRRWQATGKERSWSGDCLNSSNSAVAKFCSESMALADLGAAGVVVADDTDVDVNEADEADADGSMRCFFGEHEDDRDVRAGSLVIDWSCCCCRCFVVAFAVADVLGCALEAEAVLCLLECSMFSSSSSLMTQAFMRTVAVQCGEPLCADADADAVALAVVAAVAAPWSDLSDTITILVLRIETE